jgi:hypothetical protein
MAFFLTEIDFLQNIAVITKARFFGGISGKQILKSSDVGV